MNEIVVIDKLSHVYPPSRKKQLARTAIKELSLSVRKGEIFCLLGPNGSGKSTLFRILSTLLPPSSGTIMMFGADLRKDPQIIRRSLGVVFQHPSLDKKLTARENLLHQGHLYNLRGKSLEARMSETLALVGLPDRAHDLIESLSGGMQRRVELAKSLLHRPPLLLLDEPSTGLDPGARKEFADYLAQLRSSEGVTVLLTTHILEEAEKCDRLAILDQGRLVALGTPGQLKDEIGGDVITITSKQPLALADAIRMKFSATLQVIDNSIRIERGNGHEFIPQLAEAFPGQIESITLSKPTLEDVFIDKTGHRFWNDGND